MLMKISRRLQERGTLSLAELSSQFETDPAAMEGMLEALIGKGRVERIENPCVRCKGCGQVRREDVLLYRAVLPREQRPLKKGNQTSLK